MTSSGEGRSGRAEFAEEEEEEKEEEEEEEDGVGVGGRGGWGVFMMRTLAAQVAYVHRGFWLAYESVRPRLHSILAGLAAAPAATLDGRGGGGHAPPCSVVFCGHSLGGALASVAALDFRYPPMPLLFALMCDYPFPAPPFFVHACSSISASPCHPNRTIYHSGVPP